MNTPLSSLIPFMNEVPPKTCRERRRWCKLIMNTDAGIRAKMPHRRKSPGSGGGQITVKRDASHYARG